ncbi:MAG TPA: hypothetical protein VHQ01_08735, partial [Pyrinomonadaceae bacterium]|nr:hypothetical protein [Pyrinomonadaceae bacterium]
MSIFIIIEFTGIMVDIPRRFARLVDFLEQSRNCVVLIAIAWVLEHRSQPRMNERRSLICHIYRRKQVFPGVGF